MRLVALLFLPLLYAGCASNPAGPGPQPLAGTFDWVRSTGGFSGTDTITPAERGYAVRVVFAGSTLRVYHDSELVGMTTFSAEPDPEQLSPTRLLLEYRPSLSVFPFSEGAPESVQVGAGGRYYFNDGCCDRYVHELVKAGSGL